LDQQKTNKNKSNEFNVAFASASSPANKKSEFNKKTKLMADVPLCKARMMQSDISMPTPDQIVFPF
jgi:hypothetical protein